MRDLSLIGRILIAKQLGLSKFIHITRIVNTPEDICDEIEKNIYDFIWKGKKAKIKKSTLIGEYEEGGLKAPHIQSIIKAQQALWIKKYIDSNDAQWKFILDTYLQPCGKSLMCYCNYALDKLPKDMPIFYINYPKQWQEITQSVSYRTELSQQPQKNIYKTHNLKFSNTDTLMFVSCLTYIHTHIHACTHARAHAHTRTHIHMNA